MVEDYRLPDNSLVLRAWEAVSQKRHLQGVLDAIAGVVLPVVPFASVGIVNYTGHSHELYALHVVGVPFREGESLKEFLGRPGNEPPSDPPARPLRPYGTAALTLQTDEIYHCPDLLGQEAWYEHEFALAKWGIRAYASVPLRMGGELIGSAAFTRAVAEPFSTGQLEILARISRPLAVAVANALANEKINELTRQLEAENVSLREQLGQAPWFDGIVGNSSALRRVMETASQVATAATTVLLTGETGTGKELIARAIHLRSERAHGPMVKVNCAAIPDSLLASELFGHERGAFTGATDRRKGRFEQARGGTLFLDEIGEMSPETQVLLLRVLQEREFERLGGNQTLQADVRVIAATNRDLAEDVRNGRFRADLFYRISVFPIRVPPLRERIEDIPLLVAHFAGKHAARCGKTIARIDRRTMSALQSHAWPGNIRELENVIERGVILSRNGILRLEEEFRPVESRNGLEAELRSSEREKIETALRLCGGRIAGDSGAAKQLGMPASTLEFRIRRLGIDKYRFHPRAGQRN